MENKDFSSEKESSLVHDQLTQKNQILALIYDTVGDVIFALDVIDKNNFVFNSVNRSFLNATGLEEEMVVKKNVRDVIPEPSYSLVLQKYQHAIATKAKVTWEETTPYPTGTKIGEVTIAPIFDQEGNCTMLIGSVHDITEIKNYSVKLEETMKDLEEKNTSLEEMSYITSHDLQEPLNTIKSFCTLLTSELEGISNEKIEKYTEFINSATGRMSILVKSLLSYNLIGTKSTVSTVSVTETIEELLLDLSTQIKESKAEISFSNLPSISGFKNEIKTLFQNLISNALKYKADDRSPIVKIGFSENEQFWEFYVKDNGIGIDEKYKEKVFQIFQRLHSNTKYTGTGVGLAFCKKIVGLHKGKIWFDANTEHGSTFYFTIKKSLE